MRRALIAVFLAVTLAACGGGDDDEGAARRDSSNLQVQSEDSGAGAAGEGRAGGGPQRSSGSGNTAVTPPPPPPPPGGAGAGATTTTKPRRPVTAKLDKSCVRKGASGDEQVFTVNTDPGDTVGFSTEYSDHSNEFSNPSYKSGAGHGEADSNGVYRVTWKVPENAPDGEATIHFIAQGKIQELKPKFTVVGPLGRCP